MDVSSDWVQKALSTTGHFEDATRPFSAVTGNFDGMGISVGVLQWNIGSGSLQPLVLATDEAIVRSICPQCGDVLLRACKARPSDGVGMVSGWQSGSRIQSAILAELRALAENSSFMSQQVKAASAVAQRAFNTGTAWYSQWHLPFSLHAFCWFFDVYTQNGGVSDITPEQVDGFIGGDSSHALQTVCDWLAGRQAFEHGSRDAIKNAALWRATILADSTRLLVASYLRSQRSKVEWRADTLNRKATIAAGRGWVHGELVTLSF
jgi:hypothetical protein